MELTEFCWTDLKKSQVRWFYREPNDKRWIVFNGFDSLRLETRYRERFGFMNSRNNASGHTLPASYANNLQIPMDSLSLGEFQRANRVSVRGGFYEADIYERRCFPIYWSTDELSVRILRGTWFREGYNGAHEPLEDEAMVMRLEQAYLDWFLNNPEQANHFRHVDRTVDISSDSQQILHTVSSDPSLYLHRPMSDELHKPLYSTYISVESENDYAEDPMKIAEENATQFSTAVESKKGAEYHTVQFLNCHVDFYTTKEAYLYYESTSLYIRQKLGMSKVGTRLFRGYHPEAQESDKMPDVSHLCFVVHGIGQKMGKNPILKCCNDLREMCDKLKTRYFAKSERVEFLPIEWRSSLQLDGDTVESITPVQVRGLRTVLNNTAMDVMYYTSPLYRTEISFRLQRELNRVYSMFCTLNPNFESKGGKVSIIAHSLGCVLMYDLITGWSQLNGVASFSPSEESTNSVPSNLHQDGMIKAHPIVDQSHKLEQVARVCLQLESAQAHVSQLERELNNLLASNGKSNSTNYNMEPNFLFNGDGPSICSSLAGTSSSFFTSNSLLFGGNLQNFFCLGSPLAVFLALRGIRPGPFRTQDNILPRKLCPRIFNIYHPADPVAYRLEPLILKHYSNFQPAVIHRADATIKPCYDDLPPILITNKSKECGRFPKTFKSTVDPSKQSSTSLISFEHDQSIPNDQRNDDNNLSIREASAERAHRGSITSRIFGLFSRTPTFNPYSPLICDHELLNQKLVIPKADNEQQIKCAALSSSISYDDLTDQNNTLPIKLSLADDLIGLDDTQDLDCEEPVVSNQNNPIINTHNLSLEKDVTCLDSHLHGQDICNVDSLTLEQRLDFQLQASRYENVYISVLTSHTSYWTNEDVGMLILTHIFKNP